jgi:hypothetical protein
VWSHITPGSEGGSEDVALRMGFRILRANNAVLDEAADVGMIASQASEIAITHKVETAISDVGEAELAFDDGERGAGGAHTLKLRMFDGVALNIIVSGLESRSQGLAGVSRKIAIVNVPDGFDGETAGLLAALVSSHAVGDDG